MSHPPTSFRRVAVLGAGTMAVEHHLPRLRALPGVERIELVDRSEARRNQLRAVLAKDPTAEVLAETPEGLLDLAVIASPPAFHLEGLRSLLGRCRLFLVEKPATLTAEEARIMQREAEAAGATVAVHLMRRELPALPLVRWLYQQRAFGPLLKVTAAEGTFFDWPAASAAAFSRRQSGGGVLLDLGAHLVDQLLQVFDDLRVEQAWIDSEGDGVEANCTVDFRGDGLVPVTLVLSRNRSLSDRIVFHFERAVVTAGTTDRHLVFSEGFTACPAGRSGQATLGEMMDSFYRRRLLEGDFQGVTPAEAARSLSAIEAAYAVARPMEAVF